MSEPRRLPMAEKPSRTYTKRCVDGKTRDVSIINERGAPRLVWFVAALSAGVMGVGRRERGRRRRRIGRRWRGYTTT